MELCVLPLWEGDVVGHHACAAVCLTLNVPKTEDIGLGLFFTSLSPYGNVVDDVVEVLQSKVTLLNTMFDS